MSSTRPCLFLLVFLVSGTVNEEKIDCRVAKEKGYDLECPEWNDPQCVQECDWYTRETYKRECGGATLKQTRSRPCNYIDGETNRKLPCSNSEDQNKVIQPQCGANGFFNKALDACQCVENFDGACCDQKIEACTNPVMRKGETDRSVAHKGVNRCDNRLRPRWYRFDSPAGNDMPLKCVSPGSCNTAVPLWLNGTLPGTDEGVVDRLACGSDGKGNCCHYKLKIKVRNCLTHMAYYLVPTQGCSKAYCIGTREKCPEGQSSENGFTPHCSKEFPDLKVVPKVSYGVDETNDNNDVFLTCAATHPDAARYMWKVQWFFDGIPGPIEAEKRPSNNPEPKFKLFSKDWASKMGTKAQCTMQARYADGFGTWTPGNARSEEYYLGILIDEKEVTVKEGDTAVITLRPNLPVRCQKKYEDLGHCFLPLSISLDPTAKGPTCPGTAGEISQVIFEGGAEERCAYKEITFKTWNKANLLKIKPKLDIQLDGTQTRTLRLRVNEETSIPEFWRKYILPKVQIKILDSDDRCTCTIANDPHITTFDKRRYDFHDRPNKQGNNQIFVVYKHKTESEEVQARFTHCGGNIYCICGVAMRAGSHTMVFDRCRTNPNLHLDVNYKVPNAVVDPRMRVFKHDSGTQYHVFLPTGTQVKVHAAGGNLIWFEIKASVAIKNKSMGLCGNYDGDPKDDIQNSEGQVKCPHYHAWYRCEDESFRTSWHVPEAESIFEGKVPPHNPGEREEPLFCDCVSAPGHHGYEDCDYHKRYEPCDEGTELFKPLGRKRQADEDVPWVETNRTLYYENPNFFEAANSANRRFYRSFSPNKYTKETAQTYCTKKLFSSPAVKDCLREVPNQNYTSNIEACALDLVLTGSTEYVATHLESVKSSCKQELRMNLDLWEPRGDTAIVGPPLRLMENFCPNECRGNGACVDGKCACKRGFASYDCSLKVDDVPVIKGVSSSAVPCDRSSQDCSVIALEGMKYVEGPSLTCHFYNDDATDGQYFYSGDTRTAPVTTTAAYLFSLWVVQCVAPYQLSSPVSPQTTLNKLQVAVSNNGVKQSDRAFYGSYNGYCESCVGRNCTRKSDWCIISSECYERGELNPNNKDEACNPRHRGYAWSPVSTFTPPTTPPTAAPVRTTTPQVITAPVSVTTAVTDGENVVCNLKPNQRSLYRDPDNCNKYYECDGTLKRHMDCPIGMAFSDNLKVCVLPFWLKLKECKGK